MNTNMKFSLSQCEYASINIYVEVDDLAENLNARFKKGQPSSINVGLFFKNVCTIINNIVFFKFK